LLSANIRVGAVCCQGIVISVVDLEFGPKKALLPQLCLWLNQAFTLCIDLNNDMLYTYRMSLKRTSPKNRLAKELLLDIATGVAAALLLVLFICLVPTF
jgi:hypothetical protein